LPFLSVKCTTHMRLSTFDCPIVDGIYSCAHGPLRELGPFSGAPSRFPSSATHAQFRANIFAGPRPDD
jgi:hypothetical protein